MKSSTDLMTVQKNMAALSLLWHFHSRVGEFPANLVSAFIGARHLKSKIFEVRCVSQEYFEHLLATDTYKIHFVGDINSCALLSVHSLLILSVRSKSWIKLNKFNVESEGMGDIEDRKMNMVEKSKFTRNEYPILCYAVSSITKDFVIYVTKQKYFDILQYFNVGVMQNDNFKVQISKGQCECSPEIAKHLLLGLIDCGIDVRSSDLEVILHMYFKTPKYVRIGEVLEINIQKILLYLGGPITHINVKKLYFLVMNVVGSSDNPNNDFGYYILDKETKIVLKCDARSYLPREYTKFVYINDKTGYEISICPGGMDKYFEKLQDLFLIFLNDGESRLKPMILLKGVRGSGKKTILKCVASKLGLNLFSFNCFDYVKLDGSAFEGKFGSFLRRARSMAPAIICIDNIDLVGRDENSKEDVTICEVFQKEIDNFFAEVSQYPVIIVGSCSQKIPDLVPSIERLFIQTVSFKAMKRDEAEKLLNWLVEEAGMTCYPEIVRAVADRLNGYLFADIVKIIRIALKNQREDETLPEETPLLLTREHLEKAIGVVESHYSDSIGSAKVPTVHWDDVGGLDKLKEEMRVSLNLLTNHPELKAWGLRVSGFLFYGPPGTGKTLMAKAVATEFKYNFLSVKGPELMNMYVGQSEKNVREVFQRAREASPCIIFFDELDSLAPNRGRDSSVVMDRIVSQLLTEMDGLESNSGVFVIGATNRPDLVDPGLLRPGRFDKMFYVGICSTKEMKLKVITAVTRRFSLHDDVNLEAVADRLPGQVTGADVYSVCSNSWLEAARRRINAMNEGKGEVELPVTVNMNDFEEALKKFVPSLTPEVIQSYEKYKALER